MNIRVHWETLGRFDISVLMVVKTNKAPNFSDVGGCGKLMRKRVNNRLGPEEIKLTRMGREWKVKF